MLTHMPPFMTSYYITEVTGEQSCDVFTEYKTLLDARHDKHERLIKLSRDTTIHSKRAIFLLHRAASEEGVIRDERLTEAEDKLHEVSQFLLSIAKEIHGTDPWLHSSAFSPGLQEFIEALAYLVFLRQGQLLSIEEASHWLEFKVANQNTLEEEKEGETGRGGEEETCEEKIIKVPLSTLNYVLGIGDLTGEIMRMCITAVGAGQQDIPFKYLPFIRSIYCGFHRLQPISKEILQKLRTLRSSMAKIETACYTLQIRGSEIPQHMLTDVFHTATDVNSEHFD